MDIKLIESGEFFVSCDSLSRDSEAGFDFVRRHHSPFKKLWAKDRLALPEGEETLGLLAASSVAPAVSPSHFTVAPEFAEALGHWAGVARQNHLWISTDTTAYDSITDEIIAVLASPGLGSASSVAVKVDVSEARAIFWPLINGLVLASSDYRDELGIDPPAMFSGYLPVFSIYMPHFASYEFYRAPWPHVDDAVVGYTSQLICDPLIQRYQRLQRPLGRATLIVQGITSDDQAEELYHAISTLDHDLEDISTAVSIVVIGPPRFLRRISDPERHMMDHLCTLYVSEGSTIYSENLPRPPRLAENMFLLLVDSIQRTGGEHADRLWTGARDLARSSQENSFVDVNLGPTDWNDPTTPVTVKDIITTLHGAHKDRSRILQILRKLPTSRVDSFQSSGKDNVKIAQYLECLFDRNLSKISEEDGVMVMNLIHDVLIEDLPQNDVIQSPPRTRCSPHLH
ncbi:hypothetical protein B0H19DRAFT_1262244 [Mycena capillaripes]|nr:hypothetical protein B0H19DRAFT_1262244 [Mycena capillaripes]